MKQDVYIMTWTDLEYPFPQATRDKNMKIIVGWELEYGLDFPDREALLEHFSDQADLMDHWLNNRLSPNWLQH